ncbi:AAEL012714-PA [Aedes aegypti]|uniref:AAEL012714-PA n=1 Tax=Aedes aegypti TaxID=7159 RepID=Q16LA2_AEDAE|nr:AAEL012714-PA [Aedes aegypti]
MFNRATNAETKWQRALSARQAARLLFFPIRGLPSTRFPEEVGETVVGIYATHLGDVSNMIRTDTGLNSLLTHKPPDALLTQSSLNPLTMSTPSSLLGHALFNPSTTATMSTSGGVSNIMSSSAVGGVHGSAHSGLELAGIGVGDGTGIDIGDQLDLTGTNLITIDGTLDDRLHADDV